MDAVTVSVVIPTLNEAENLPYVLPRVPPQVAEVLIVDGNSTDDTVRVAKEVLPRARILYQQGRGKGAALRTGITMATGDIVVLLDADGSCDPAEIPAFVGALLAGAHFAKGTRFLQGAGTADMPAYRRLGNWGLVVLTNVLFRTRFSDITYGYNAIWREHASALALEIDGWAQEIVSNIRVARNGLSAVEVASFEHARLAGQAKLQTVSAGWAILKAILAVRLRPSRRWRPVLGALGAPAAAGWPREPLAALPVLPAALSSKLSGRLQPQPRLSGGVAR